MINPLKRTEEFEIRSYNQKELAALYRCSHKTFSKWMQKLRDDLGPRIGNYYSPRQVRIIVDWLGEP